MSRLCRLQIRQVKKMERDSFVFYRSFYEAIRRQPKKVQADIYNTIADYALNGTEPTQASDAVLSIFLLIKPQIDANNHRYTAGKKGGRPSKTDSNKKEEKTKTVIYLKIIYAFLGYLYLFKANCTRWVLLGLRNKI